MLFAYLFKCASCLWSGLVRHWSGKLVTELFGYCLGLGVCLVVEGDGLVGILVWPLS